MLLLYSVELTRLTKQSNIKNLNNRKSDLLCCYSVTVANTGFKSDVSRHSEFWIYVNDQQILGCGPNTMIIQATAGTMDSEHGLY